VPGVPEDWQPEDVQRLQAGGLLQQGGAEDRLARPQDRLQGGHQHCQEAGRQPHHREGEIHKKKIF